MKKLYKTLLIAVLSVAMTMASQAQRYLQEVFTDVTVDTSVVYGVNATILYYQFVNQAVPEALMMDVYHPTGDTLSERPLVLYFHTGNFLPHPQNGSPSGTRRDLNVVEMCSRLARMGYVVASCDYRLGWNPIATAQEERVSTLINAAYRGVQDCRTAIRYFRKSEAEQSNPFRIDPDRICVWGQGTGGYIAFASATLDNYSDILIPKFTSIDTTTGNPVPMVIEFVNGDIYGTSVGFVPPTQDTLCYPNHVGYSSDFNVMVNMGGALGDSSWLDASDIPMISIHSPTDMFAPYGVGTVIVPGFNLPVVEVSGSGHVQEMANALGLNNAFTSIEPATDVYSVQANLYNNGYYGLYPLNRPADQMGDSSPWEWWTPDNVNNQNGLLSNPTMSETKGMTYLDTIQGYVAPRLMCALNIPGNPCETATEVNSTDYVNEIRVYPNPANDVLNVVGMGLAASSSMVRCFDITGKIVFSQMMSAKSSSIDVSMLDNGSYILVIGNDQVATRTMFVKN